MDAARPHTAPEEAEAPPGLSPRRRARDDSDIDLETWEPQRERWRTTGSLALLALSSVDVEDEGRLSTIGPDDAAGEDASYASLVETALSVCSQVFVADEKFMDVIEILQEQGWMRSRHADSPNFTLKWRNLSNINFRLLRGDQFVNHLFNSQQLSNKALLAGHLAFYQYHHAASKRGNMTLGSAYAEDAVTWPSQFVSHARHDGTCRVTNDEVHREISDEPDTFFPRCWDVSSGRLSSLLRAFGIAAAVALLRNLANDEGMRRTNNTGTDSKEMAQGLAAAVSVVFRYVDSLHGEHSADNRHWEGGPRQPTRQACGQRAMDTSVILGEPEWIAIIKTWEETLEREGDWVGEGEHVMKESSEHGGQSGEAIAQGASNSAKNVVDNATSLKTRARELLRDLDNADPQSSLMGRANAWIIKPVGQSCGRGVSATSSLRSLLSSCRELQWKAVVQKYVECPLLIQGFKFDIRQWVLVTSCNPLMVWGFDESYIRFSSSPFTLNASTLSDRFIHLCNHAIQKERSAAPSSAAKLMSAPSGPSLNARVGDGKGIGKKDSGSAGDDGGRGIEVDSLHPSGSQSNMWSVDQFRRYLFDHFQGRDVYGEVILPHIRAVVVQTLLSVREALEMKGRALEWLGFDFMVTNDLRVMLIEVNVSPDVSHSTPVTARLVPMATKDALRLLLDEAEAEARISSSLASSDPSVEAKPCSRSQSSRMRTTNLNEAAPAVAEDAHLDSVTPEHTKPLPIPVNSADGAETLDTITENKILRSDEPLRWRLWHMHKEESLMLLRSLRNEKKAWFLSRRQPRQHHVGDALAALGLAEEYGLND